MRAILIAMFALGLLTIIPAAWADPAETVTETHEELSTTCVEVSLTHSPPVYTYTCDAGVVP